MIRRFALLLLAAAVLAAPASSARAAGEDPSRELSIPSAEVRRGDVVALGRQVTIAGRVYGTLVLVGSTVELSGEVTGDVVAFGGTVRLVSGSRIGGDLLGVGASVDLVTPASASQVVGGRVLTVAALEAAFLAELRTSPLTAKAISPLLLGFRLILLLLWLAVGLGLLFLKPRRLSVATGFVPGRLPLLAVIGTTAFLTALLVSAFVVALVPAKASLPIVLLICAALLSAKAFGLAAVFVAVGRRVTRGVPRGSSFFGDPAALSVGLMTLGALSLVPGVGAVSWAIASLVGIGLAMQTSFGRPAPGV